MWACVHHLIAVVSVVVLSRLLLFVFYLLCTFHCALQMFSMCSNFVEFVHFSLFYCLHRLVSLMAICSLHSCNCVVILNAFHCTHLHARSHACDSCLISILLAIKLCWSFFLFCLNYVHMKVSVCTHRTSLRMVFRRNKKNVLWSVSGHSRNIPLWWKTKLIIVVAP